MIGFKDAGDITEIVNLKEFDNHSLVSFVQDKEAKLTAVIAVHRSSHDVPSFGATRFWHYTTSLEGVKDALRLSRLMSYKAALAGLRCGGAKGVIIAESDPNQLKGSARTRLLEAYATRVSLLGGRFVTGTDVGITQDDLNTMRKVSRHIIGFNDNSTEFTALGISKSIIVACEEVFGTNDLSGRSIAIQGLGKIGEGVLSRLYEPFGTKGKIFVSDLDATRAEDIKRKYPRVAVVSSNEIDKQEVDIFCPCALSGALNTKSIKTLRAKIVVGGANNQLDSEASGDALHARGILYAPDYVVNAGGLIAIFDEYKNPAYDRARVEKAVLHVPETVKKIFAESRAENIAPSRVANQMAERIFNGYSLNV